MKLSLPICHVTLLVSGVCFTAVNAFAQVKHPETRPLITGYTERMITRPPLKLSLDTFYQKYTDAGGIPVVASARVSADALFVASDIINYMLSKRPDIRERMIKMGTRVSVIGKTEGQTDLPECRDWKKPAFDDNRLTSDEKAAYYLPNGIAGMTDKAYWDKRARGMGGVHTSCAEENLLGIPGTVYFGENILVHEFSHNIMLALTHIEPDFYKRLETAYNSAKAKQLYPGQYAVNTIAEYWAEGTQWWFWSNFEFYDHNTRVQTPDDLRAYDPGLYALLEKVYPGHHIPADIYYGKNLK